MKIIKIPFFMIILVLLFSFHFVTLMRTPAPHVDEAWLVSRAIAFSRTGIPYGSLDQGILDLRFEHYWLTYQVGITALQALVLKLSNGSDLFALRLFSLFWGICLLMANYYLAQRFLGRPAVLLSTLVLGLSMAFTHSAHQVRYDMMAAALGYISLSLVVQFPSSSRKHLLAGLILGMAIETHLNSLLFIPPVGIVYVFYCKQTIWKDRQIRAFLAGLACILVLYLLWHVIPDPEDYWNAFHFIFGGQISQNIFQRINTLMDIWLLLFVAGGSFTLLLIPAGLKIWCQPDKNVRFFGILCLTIIISAAFIIPNKTAHYGIYLASPVASLGSWWFIQTMQNPWGRGEVIKFLWKNYLSRILAISMLVGSLGLSILSIIPDQQANYTQDCALIEPYIRSTDRIMGSQAYWFNFSEHTYLSWELLFLYPRAFPNSSIKNALEFYRPDILIIDQPIQDLISDKIDPSSRWINYHISRQEWETIMMALPVEITILQTHINPPLMIYRINWSK